MPYKQPLSPASAEEIAEALAAALRLGESERAGDAGRFLALLAAERILQLVEQAGYVLMKELPAGASPPRPAT